MAAEQIKRNAPTQEVTKINYEPLPEKLIVSGDSFKATALDPRWGYFPTDRAGARISHKGREKRRSRGKAERTDSCRSGRGWQF